MHLPNSRYGYKRTTTPYQTYRTEARPQPLTYYNYHPAAPVRVAAPVKAVHAPVTRTQHKQAYPQPFTVFNHQPVTRVAAPVKAVHTPLRANPAPVRPIPTPVRAAPAPVTRTGPTQIDTSWGKFIKSDNFNKSYNKLAKTVIRLERLFIWLLFSIYLSYNNIFLEF